MNYINKNNNINITNKPIIFLKKVNNKHKTIPVNLTTNTEGVIKHFPAATREWNNSIYTYNNNYTKNINITNKNLSKLIKSYFNFFFKRRVLKTKRIRMRFRRLFVKKIFFSKAEVRHTNNKVNITLFVYNAEKKYLTRVLNLISYLLYPSRKYIKNLTKKVRRGWLDKENLPFFFDQGFLMYFLRKKYISVFTWYWRNASFFLKEFTWAKKEFKKIKKRRNKKLNLLNRAYLLKQVEYWINMSISAFKNIREYNERYFEHLQFTELYYDFIDWRYYKVLYNLNNNKFKYFFIKKLLPLIYKLYNNNYSIYNKKSIELNIVNIKNLYYNSDIYTQIISLKLRNRKNRLLKVLKSALSKIKLPKIHKKVLKYNKISNKYVWQNKVNNLNIDILSKKFISYNHDTDILNYTLKTLFSEVYFFNKKTSNSNVFSNNKGSLLNYLLRSLKYKDMLGVRLEVKGRLTRRLTASKSIFKLRWKGGIRNIDSSYKKQSAVMLRGHITPNVQYSFISSKTRNGAFGLKGWIGGK